MTARTFTDILGDALAPRPSFADLLAGALIEAPVKQVREVNDDLSSVRQGSTEFATSDRRGVALRFPEFLLHLRDSLSHRLNVFLDVAHGGLRSLVGGTPKGTSAAGASVPAAPFGGVR